MDCLIVPQHHRRIEISLCPRATGAQEFEFCIYGYVGAPGTHPVADMVNSPMLSTGTLWIVIGLKMLINIL